MNQPRFATWLGAFCLVCVPAAAAADAAAEHPLLSVMESELKLSLEKLQSTDGTKPYFLQYTISDSKSVNVGATLGAVTSSNEDHRRQLDVDVRCGDYTLDSTRQIRDERGFSGGFDFGGGAVSLPLDDDPIATRQAIWLKTDERFKEAVKRLARVQANLKVKVEEEDPSDDFSREQPSVSVLPWLTQSYDLSQFEERAKRYSAVFRDHPLIYNSSITINASVGNVLLVNSEGSKLQYGQGIWRIGIQAATIAPDGMELWQYTSFDAHTPDGLPDDATILAGVQKVIDELMALREAPVVEPYTGPAILMNRASGVFFHEIFGHRIEGHRQKDVEEGQTFAKMLGQEVLPTFLSVVDDPSRKTLNGIDLNGFYYFDDEAVPAQPAGLVKDGVLQTFLMSRSPTRGINKSNGHGRRSPGMRVVARQGNLFVDSTKQVPFPELRTMLIDEARQQGKEYGLLFVDISGGFTNTQRTGPQAFKVLPIIVYRIYVDGRPDELVRGADVVGTPLTCFSKILATGDDPAVFNGVCGAESGWVPVSAISPSILVQQIEIEKKQKAQDRPPILEAPIAAIRD